MRVEWTLFIQAQFTTEVEAEGPGGWAKARAVKDHVAKQLENYTITVDGVEVRLTKSQNDRGQVILEGNAL